MKATETNNPNLTGYYPELREKVLKLKEIGISQRLIANPQDTMLSIVGQQTTAHLIIILFLLLNKVFRTLKTLSTVYNKGDNNYDER